MCNMISCCGFTVGSVSMLEVVLLGMFRLTETKNSVNRCFCQNRNRFFTSKKTETEKLKI